MSTNFPKTNLALIFYYGREAFTNRRKDLFLIVLSLIFLPDLVTFFVWQTTSEKTVQLLNTTTTLSPLAQLEALASSFSSMIVGPLLITGIIKILGVLALARSCVDYFESRPVPVKESILGAVRVFATKGLGAAAMLLVVSPVLLIMPFLRTLALSMLVMLPVTLVASSHGGFRTTLDTIFLRYATKTPLGRWPVFINVLSVTGLFLTALFGVSFLADQIAVFDVITGIPAGFLEKTIDTAGIHMNVGLFITQILNLIWSSVAVMLVIPFTAALYHLSTAPSDHVSFATNA